MFWKKTDKIKKLDKVVTGVILWSVIASVFWLKKYKDSKKKEEIPENENNLKNNFWIELFTNNEDKKDVTEELDRPKSFLERLLIWKDK